MSLEKILASKFLYHSFSIDSEKQADRRSGYDRSKGVINSSKYRPEVILTLIGISLGVAVILLSFFVIAGFKHEIRGKVNALLGSYVISNPDNLYNQYTMPLSLAQGARDDITSVVRNCDPTAGIYSFANCMTLLKADSAFSGVMFHGVDEAYDWRVISSYMVEGRIPNIALENNTTEVVISKAIMSRLGLFNGAEVMSYFFDSKDSENAGNGLKLRKLKVVGVFDTGFEQYDQKIIIGDSRLAQGVNGWDDNQVSGLMIQLNNENDHLTNLYDRLYTLLADRYAKYGERYTMTTAEELSNGLLQWIGLLDANVLLILTLLTAVAGMTMITGIIVLVLEKVRMIAILKALGQKDHSLKKAFRYVALSILGKGLLWGNIVALMLASIQYIWHPLTLDASQYYMNYVPVRLEFLTWLFVNIVVAGTIYLLVLIPVGMISKVRPAQSLRFD